MCFDIMVMLCSGAHTRVNADRSVSPRLHVAHHRESERERDRDSEREAPRSCSLMPRSFPRLTHSNVCFIASQNQPSVPPV